MIASRGDLGRSGLEVSTNKLGNKGIGFGVEPWFSTRGDLLAMLETFLVTTTGGGRGCYWHLVGTTQGFY